MEEKRDGKGKKRDEGVKKKRKEGRRKWVGKKKGERG